MLERIDIEVAMESLAKRRPVFHSEADFQFALAWELQKHDEEVGVRLEYPVPLEGKRRYIDIWLRDGGCTAAIELKYLRYKTEVSMRDERFSLRSGLRDLDSYDLWKDVVRIEKLIDTGTASSGYVIALSNDSGHWGRRGGTIDEAFYVYQGREVSGELAWKPGSKPGKEYEAPLSLQGLYYTHWRNFSALDSPNGAFRYLLLDVGAALAETES